MVLCYNPSVNSSPARTSIKSAPSESDAVSYAFHAGSGPSHLQFLLDFVRRENKRERTFVTLSSFPQRVRRERDEVEVRLHEVGHCGLFAPCSAFFNANLTNCQGEDSR